MIKNRDNNGFTLVELIVVITILSVLSTIWFLSFQWHWISSRDAVRLSDMRMIEKWLSVKISKAEEIPIPDNKIDITASGVLLTYQWYAWTGTLWNIWVNWAWKDPLDGSYYTYVTNTDRNKYQLLGFFENQWNISLLNTTYANYIDRFPKVSWDDLGILLDPINNNPIQLENNNIEVVHTNNEYKILMSNTDFSTWTGEILSSQLDFRINERWSCKSLLKNGYLQWNGIYQISIPGEWEIDVYCSNSTYEWDWWTLLSSVPWESSIFWDKSTTGIWKNPYYNLNNLEDFINNEYLSQAYSLLKTNEILLCYQNIHTCYNFKHNKNISFFDFFDKNIPHVEYTTNLAWYWDQWSIESLQKYFSIFWLTWSWWWACKFFWINSLNDSNATSNIIWFISDNDGPCISKNNNSNHRLDNNHLWVAGNLRFANKPSAITPHNLAGYQKVYVNDFTSLPTSSWQNVYLSKTWYIFWR